MQRQVQARIDQAAEEGDIDSRDWINTPIPARDNSKDRKRMDMLNSIPVPGAADDRSREPRPPLNYNPPSRRERDRDRDRRRSRSRSRSRDRDRDRDRKREYDRRDDRGRDRRRRDDD